MKKTTPTTLAGTLFYIEEDAYIKLSEYLDSIKKHFASYADSAEIISDIESRIAEQFLEHKDKQKENIVTIENVEALIASMGNAEDFSGEENPEGAAKKESSEHMKKKLFRNPDDVIVAGVASGLAAYFGIDPIIVRLLFILIVIFGGSGILIYIILWLIVPEAKTSTEKLQMRGEPVTLESVKELAKEKVNEVKANKGTFRKIIGLPFIIIGKIFSVLLPIARTLIGLAVTLLGGAAIFFSLFTLILVLFNIQSPYVDFPLMQIGHHFLIYTIMFAIFFIIFVPALFFLLFGVKILSRKNIFHSTAVLSLSGLWFLSLILAGVISIRLVPEYQNFVATSPIYQETSMEFAVSGFTGLKIENGNKVFVSNGPEFKVTANGSSQSLSDLSMEVKDNVLVIDHPKGFKICIFCVNSTPEILITMPVVGDIALSNGSRITGENINSDALSLKLSNGSTANLNMDAKSLVVTEENSSWSVLSGRATNADFRLENGSNINATDMKITNAKITGKNGSVAEIDILDSLDVNLQNGSLVIYEGDPDMNKITKKLNNGSRLEKRSEDRDQDEDEDEITD